MSEIGAHPYAAFLRKVEKPSRYIGGEYNQVRKAGAGIAARVCLAFPDVYEIGMSHLGTKILYSLLNKTEGVACERAFMPWLDMEAELRARRLPLLTLESARPLLDFDVVGISLQYELTYTNVLALLDLSGIPLRAAERGDRHPLVLCGGPTATHPEPLAPFVDAFFIGEAEEKLPPLVLEAAAMRRESVPRRERLARLAAKYPLYVPELYAVERDPETGFLVVGDPLDPRAPRRPARTWIADINRFPFPDDSPLPYAEAIFDRMAVEIARGCTEGCRFCQAGIIYRPVRERDPVAVIDALVEGVRKGGYDETSLTSLSTADYSCVSPLVKAAMAKLREAKVSLSVSSLRAYGLNDDLLADMATMKAQGLTFAPEAGTQRMRDVITKNVTENDIVESAHRVFGHGFDRMKLYFMIGLPTEEDTDVRGIIETAARVQAIGRSYRPGARVTASVSTHVPKPHTPFQWAAMDSAAETERKQALLAECARTLRVDLKMHENHQSHLEAVFSRGDRACADVLERAFRIGCRFDGWDDVLRTDLWDRAMDEAARATGFDPARYLGTIRVDVRLPWDHIDVAVDPAFLAAEYRRALKDRLSPPCGKPKGRLLHHGNVADARAGAAEKLVCYECGIACDLEGMKHERLTYLRRMNAWTAPAVPAPAARAEPGPRARGRRPQPTTSIDQEGPARRVRVRYTKLGRAAYLGHLDLVRHLPRIFRRAGIELFYSSGFHPKPEFSFGPALGLGIASYGEVLDVKLADAAAPADLCARLNSCSLDGVTFLAAAALDAPDRPLGRILGRADYAALLPFSGEAAMAREVLRSARPLATTRAGRQGIGRRVDVRRWLCLIDADPDGVPEAVLTLGWRPERTLVFGLALAAEGGARPQEVMASILGSQAATEVEIVRLGLRARGVAGTWIDPLDVVGLRSASAPGAGEPAAAAVAASA